MVVPGPTLRLRPGDELAIRLVNSLDEPTDLHVHGLHVSPAANSDNVFVAVGPGESFDYSGRSVYHCHILDHEDLGMMGVIEVR